jgi:flagellar biosynthesis/type III secretory pathway chaperone
MDLTQILGAARRLSELLDEEFEILKAQNLPALEHLQAEKTNLIKALAGLDVPASSLPSLPLGEDFQQAVLDCKEKHHRNSLLIQRKLDAIKGALRTLQGVDSTSSVEVYDRLGRISAGRNRRNYADA